MPTEADTCRTYIVPKLKSAGWEDDYITNIFTPTAKEILNELLDKYADYGIGEFDQLPRVLQVSPFDTYGSPYEIYQLFGGAEKLRVAVDELQKLLYE